MRRTLAGLSVILLATGLALAQDKPESLVLNGGFERQGGWAWGAKTRRVPSARGGLCLEVPGNLGVSQELSTEGLSGRFTAAVDLKAEDVKPVAGAGYAYVAVYQFSAEGDLVAFRDFGQASGTKDWARAQMTFDLAPRAATISLRCGIYNATGTAWFDNWTLVAGETARGFDEVDQVTPGARPATPTAAVFREAGFPVTGAASSPERLGKLLEQGGLKVEYLSAADLATPRRLRPDRYDLLVLPYGQSFPAPARAAVLQYLHLGGSFLATGGYVFNRLLLPQDGRWVEEHDVLAAEIARALKVSVLPDGGFEQTGEAPVGGQTLDSRWHRDHGQCTVVSEGAHEGQRCAQVTVAEPNVDERKFYLNLPPEVGMRYRVSGWVRTSKVAGSGFAYLALYEYGADDKLLRHRDYAQVRGTTDWQQFSYDFMPEPGTTRIFMKQGLFRATGTAWFDDLRLCKLTRMRAQPMNTATGDPGDGLGLASWQIGAFDASFPLRRVARVQPGDEQYLFPAGGGMAGELNGWAAAGVQGYDNARWVELLDSRDRFGRKRGAAGALMVNYNGYYAGSMWAFFGAENRDLFDGKSPWLDQGLVNVARFMARGLFLRNLETNLALYQEGEAVKPQVVVQNNGLKAATGTVRFSVADAERPGALAWSESKPFTAPPGESVTVSATWQPGRFGGDTYQARATLVVDGAPLDEMSTGFMVRRPAVQATGPTLRMQGNYFTLNGRPLFLFGSDTYSNTYKSSTENPWTWHLDHVAARDFGFNLYENLQYCNPDYTYSDAEWRQFRAMAQSTQREGLVFMPCQLCGHDVAISDELLAKEAAECTAYGENLRDVPGLLYYLNGDFQFTRKDTTTLTALWNRWLADKYREETAWRAAWGEEVYGEWGKLAYPPPGPRGWDSVRQCDVARFEVDVTRRWVNRHVQAVRAADREHPITSEYYQQPYNGIDLILSIGDQDCANIGYFDAPERDLERLPLALRLNDLRARGKSVALGEYGVKTHPAWAVENGARGYHPVRTEQEQQQLFMAVAHYGMGMGASKVQNWCLRDASEWVFPWGVFYPNGRVPRDVAYWHRNLSLAWRFFAPKYVAPPVTVMQPDGLRLGENGGKGVAVAMNCFRALVDLGANFNVVNEQNAEALTKTTKALVWPSPLCPDDVAYARVRDWVKAGGKLLVTGDLSRDSDRRRTRTKRLEELCGVEFDRELQAPPTREAEGAAEYTWNGRKLTLAPMITVKPFTGRVELATADGVPLLVRHRLGQGEVLYCTDALETGDESGIAPTLRSLYGAFVTLYLPPGAAKLEPALRLSRQPLSGGGEFVTVFNCRPASDSRSVDLSLGKTVARVQVDGHYPAFAATGPGDKLVAVGASGEVRWQGEPVLSGHAQTIAVSLDGESLPASAAVLLCPFTTGELALRSQRKWRDPVLLVGDLQDGHWRTLETRRGQPALKLDADTMTCLLLACERGEAGKWTALLEQMATRPWSRPGY